MRIIRVSLLAFGLILALQGVTAAGASAASVAEWQIEGKTLEGLELKEESVKGIEVGPFEFSTIIGLAKFVLKCEGSNQSGAIAQEGTGNITLEFSKCSDNIPSCSVSSVTGKTSSELIENGASVLFEKLKPASGETLIKVGLTGSPCALGESVTVTGSLCEKAATLGEEKVKQPFISSQAIEEEFGCSLHVGSQAAKLTKETKQELSLAGSNAGKEWSALRAVLCKMAPEASGFCKAGQAFRGTLKAELISGQEIKLVNKGFLGGEITCNESVLEGPFSGNGLGILNVLTFTAPPAEEEKCTSTINPGEAKVKINFIGSLTRESVFVYESGFTRSGSFRLSKVANKFLIKIEGLKTPEESNIACTYELLSPPVGDVYNPGSEMKLEIDGGEWKAIEADPGVANECPGNFEWKPVNYEIFRSGHSNLWVTRPK